MPPEIRQLPALVAAQIAAGEVVERPASVVKELVDNAIDAGASRISVEIEQGGIELVRVSDDGHGIEPAQLPLALAAHATSKIRSAADLDRITTMGFRGEALASIASVSRLSIRSRTRAAPGASLIEVEGGEVRPLRPEAGPVGTAVSVRNLFFNTPARRKFVRTPGTEQGHCADVVRALAFSHPHIGFAFRADSRTLFDLPPNQGPRDRALAILGREMEGQYLEAHADEFDDTRGLSLWGLVGMPALARPTAAGQHLFINGRPVRDRTIQHALKEAYRGLIEPARHPAALLMILMDPGAVDVNVHPAKAEVRFRDGGLVHSVVNRAVREALRGADLTPIFDRTPPGAASAGTAAEAGATGTGVVSLNAAGLAGFLSRPVPMAPTGRFDYESVRAAVERADAVLSREAPPASGAMAPGADQAGGGAVADGLPRAMPAARVLQVHNSFLVTQDEQGVLIIDQHALHERIMFEKLRERLDAGDLESQRLLVPAVVDVAPARLELLGPLAKLLTRLGVDAQPLGPGTLAVHSFPTFLFDRGVNPGAFLSELLERAEAEGWGVRGGQEAPETLLHEALDMMACKAAVRAGDSLAEEDMRELVALRERIERSSNCPHGRPTTVRLTIKELERLFGRS